MASRILYWNIQDFAVNKINNPDAVAIQPGSTLTRNVASQQRLNYLLSNLAIAGGFGSPNIIVVVEVETGFDGNGQLVRGAGMQGAIELLGAIRGRLGDRWALVPPLQTGPNEGVAVYYDSETLVFSGPYVWPGGDAGRVPGDRLTGTAPQAYPQRLWNLFPAAVRQVPQGSRFNAGVFEDMCAARTRFTYAPSAGILAGTPIPYIRQRSPYMVTFAEIDGVTKNFTRNISIFGIHAPAWSWSARNYLRGLATTQQVVEPMGDREVRVIAGDFNVNLMEEDLTRTQAYSDFLALSAAPPRPNYTIGYDPLVPAPGLPQGYKGYYTTHIKPTEHSRYWSTAGNPSYYPAYGYLGSSLVTNFYAIDNFFTCYAPNAPLPGLRNLTILNGVVGSPFGVQVPPYGGAPVGSLPLPIAMAAGGPGGMLDPQPQAPPFSIGLYNSFTGWGNYGHIRSTSDHLALVMDI